MCCRPLNKQNGVEFLVCYSATVVHLASDLTSSRVKRVYKVIVFYNGDL